MGVNQVHLKQSKKKSVSLDLKAKSEKIVAASTELEKVESEAKFEQLALVQDLYLVQCTISTSLLQVIK